MVNKKYRKVIGSTENKQQYLEEHPVCECCHQQAGNVHHHIPQQFTFRGNGYIFELKINYSTLCVACHGIIEHNENQYYRDLKPKYPWLPDWEYWKTMKEGKEPIDFIEEIEQGAGQRIVSQLN